MTVTNTRKKLKPKHVKSFIGDKHYTGHRSALLLLISTGFLDDLQNWRREDEIIKQEKQNMKIKFVFGTALYVTISKSYTDKFRCRVPLIFFF